jgi:phosphatidylserine decarboxylase
VTLIWLGLLFFMRDPQRIPPPETGIYLAPADGKVVAIDRVDEESFVGGSTVRIAIFLSLFDVHVNRSPAAGEIRKVRHVPGRFLQAFRPEASQVNEYNDIGLEDGASRILVKQIAGILARRIVCSVREGDHVRAGQRVGMIKFGSRTEVFLPPDCQVAVSLGDKVRGGLTILARQRG